MTKFLAMAYSLVCYAIGVAALVYLILFTADLFVPATVNTPSPFAPALHGPAAIGWNIALVAAWGAQHTFMASPGFKAWWTKIVPAPIERSTYLVFVALMTAALAAFWAPVEGIYYDLSGTMAGNVVLGIFFLGWVITLIATFLINHFHLFGLQQAYHLIAKTQSKSATFKTPLFYKLVRHPMMTGILIALWAAPTLSVNRLVFNLAMTAYIFIGIFFEEKTLVRDLGEKYIDYRRTTPSVIPGLHRS